MKVYWRPLVSLSYVLSKARDTTDAQELGQKEPSARLSGFVEFQCSSIDMSISSAASHFGKDTAQCLASLWTPSWSGKYFEKRTRVDGGSAIQLILVHHDFLRMKRVSVIADSGNQWRPKSNIVLMLRPRDWVCGKLCSPSIP